MTPPCPNRNGLAWQQLLAAAADGELDLDATLSLRAWLDQHPEYETEATAQNDLSPRNAGFWWSVSIAGPNESTWDRVWATIDGRIGAESPVEPARRSGRFRRRMLAAIAALTPIAVALVVAVAFLRHGGTPNQVRPDGGDDGQGDVMPIAAGHDVEIHSIRDADETQLVVGRAPVTETLALASAADVRLDGLAPGWDGILPQMELGGANVPMIFPSVVRNP